jgi:ubiquinone biosynthesis protein UbiJ
MLERAALFFLNHLLLTEGWALTRLKPFSGQHARFDMGPLSFGFSVSADGSLHPVESSIAPEVAIRLPDDTPFRILGDRSGIFQAARISGSADFAEALGFVARNLRWDAEADLAGVIGDVPAHRLVREASASLSRKQEALKRLGANVAEFIADEEELLVRPPPLASYCSEVDRLRDDLARLEKRIARL